MEYIKLNINHALSKGEKVLIANKNWQEVINHNYELTNRTVASLLESEEQHKPNNQLDAEEREDIMKFFIEFDFSDIHTRQCVFQPKYKEDNTKSACISAMQAIIRNGEIDLHVFVRSQNFDSNFMYDNVTYALVINSLAKKLNVKISKVHVKIVSLHRLI